METPDSGYSNACQICQPCPAERSQPGVGAGRDAEEKAGGSSTGRRQSAAPSGPPSSVDILRRVFYAPHTSEWPTGTAPNRQGNTRRTHRPRSTSAGRTAVESVVRRMHQPVVVVGQLLPGTGEGASPQMRTEEWYRSGRVRRRPLLIPAEWRHAQPKVQRRKVPAPGTALVARLARLMRDPLLEVPAAAQFVRTAT